jgi:hypothetical protein
MTHAMGRVVLPLCFLAAVVAATPPSSSDVTPVSASVLCTSGGPGVVNCTLGDLPAASWTARAQLTDETNVTGWASLTLESNAQAADSLQAYAAGYVEGALTAPLINLNWQNMRSQTEKSDKTVAFIQDNVAWIRGQVTANPADPYWISVGLVLAQFDGMVDGYNANRGGLNPLTSLQQMLVGMVEELGDFSKCVGIAITAS